MVNAAGLRKSFSKPLTKGINGVTIIVLEKAISIEATVAQT